MAKIKCLAKHLIGEPYRKELIELTKFTILNFPRVFQYAFYLLGYDQKEICEKGTNMMEWKKAHKLINEEFFKRLENYKQRGQKSEICPKYRTLNTIEKTLEEYKEEDVFGYSIALGQLLKWIKESIKIRKQDIIARKLKEQAEKENIVAKKKEKEEWEKKREEELQLAIKEAQTAWEADLEKLKKEKEEEDEFASTHAPEEKKQTPAFTFNEAEFREEWAKKNPAPEIPPDIVEEVDNDCTVELPPPTE